MISICIKVNSQCEKVTALISLTEGYVIVELVWLLTSTILYSRHVFFGTLTGLLHVLTYDNSSLVGMNFYNVYIVKSLKLSFPSMSKTIIYAMLIKY